MEIELQGFFSMLFVNALRADDCQRAHFSITTVLLFVVQPWLNMDVESCALDSVDADILLLMSQAKEKQDANTGRGKKRKAGSGPDGEGQEQQSEAAPKKRAKCARHCKGCKQKIAAEDCAPTTSTSWRPSRAKKLSSL